MSGHGGGWADVCPLSALEPDRGSAALVDGRQLAIFRLSSPAGGLRALDNRDPVSGANVLARGLIGSVGPVVYVASPMHKERYDLDTGRSLDDPQLSVGVWPVRVRDGRVEVRSA